MLTWKHTAFNRNSVAVINKKKAANVTCRNMPNSKLGWSLGFWGKNFKIWKTVWYSFVGMPSRIQNPPSLDFQFSHFPDRKPKFNLDFKNNCFLFLKYIVWMLTCSMPNLDAINILFLLRSLLMRWLIQFENFSSYFVRKLSLLYRLLLRIGVRPNSRATQ